MRDESRTLRDRHAGLLDEAGRLDGQAGPLPGPMLVQTKTVTTYPTAAGKYYAVAPVDPGGSEGEGNTGTFAVGSTTFYALNAGSVVPPSGTKVIAMALGGRWVFVYNG
jgi:hypothetical protein